jgi:hypothetical protein
VSDRKARGNKSGFGGGVKRISIYFELLFFTHLYVRILIFSTGEPVMLRELVSLVLLVAMVMGIAIRPAFAETPAEVLAIFKAEAAGTPGFKDFSAARGAEFFKNKHGGEWSCASCHTDNPASQGKHAKSDKIIKPLAPSANPERFTEMKKIEKWYKRNCNDVLERECTAQEKGDVLAYLLTIK